MKISILHYSFDLEEASEKEVSDFTSKKNTERETFESYQILAQKILVRKDLPVQMKKYCVFHSIWEILLTLLGQYFNHEGFSGFSNVLFSTIIENRMQWLFSGEGDDYPEELSCP